MERSAYNEKQQLEIFKRHLHLKKTRLIIEAFCKDTGYSKKYGEARLLKYRKEGKLDLPIRKWGKHSGTANKATTELPEDYDEFSDKLMQRLELAKNAALWKREAEKYKKGYNNMREYASELEKENKKIKERRLQYKQALQQGDIKEPL